MKAVAVLVLLVAGIWPQAGPPNGPLSPAVKEHIRQVIQTLPSGSGMRMFLERGDRGDGVHQPWMDGMKGSGVKRALIEVYFVWGNRPQEMRIVRRMFFSRYDCGCAQITEGTRLDKIRASGLERTLDEVAQELTGKSSWFCERPRQSAGRQGISYVELFDDEWLPHGPPAVLQPVDPERSPLVQAAALGDQIDLAKLLSGRVDPKDRDEALMAAASSDNPCATELLIKAGADVNTQKGEYGYTPLIMAIGSEKPGNVRVLLARGASVGLRDKLGETPLSIAKRQHEEEIIELLTQAGARD